MTSKRADISVVIAAYNRGTRIAATLDSVLNQTVPATEIVVVDDGSTDDTVQFVQSNYPDVRVIQAPHGGQSAARNRGAMEARSDTIVFFDSDDIMHKEAIATFAEIQSLFPEAQAIFTDHRYVNHVSGIVYENHHSTLPQFGCLNTIQPVRSQGMNRLYDRRLYYQLLRGNILQQPWAVRRNCFINIGGFAEDLRSNEDWDLYLRIVHNHPVVVSDHVLSTHVVESERNHVHLSDGQAATNMTVLQRHGVARGWADLRAQLPIRRKLGLYHKAFGDQAQADGDTKRAIDDYFQSLCQWPFDHVVAARLFLWSLRSITTRQNTITNE